MSGRWFRWLLCPVWGHALAGGPTFEEPVICQRCRQVLRLGLAGIFADGPIKTGGPDWTPVGGWI